MNYPLTMKKAAELFEKIIGSATGIEASSLDDSFVIKTGEMRFKAWVLQAEPSHIHLQIELSAEIIVIALYHYETLERDYRMEEIYDDAYRRGCEYE